MFDYLTRFLFHFDARLFGASRRKTFHVYFEDTPVTLTDRSRPRIDLIQTAAIMQW